MSQGFHTIGRRVASRLSRQRVPKSLSARFRRLGEAQTAQLRRALEEHYFVDQPHCYLESDQGRTDLEKHTTTRLEKDRRQIIPWLNQVRRLEGASILEIGCGTGCSTVALAEQGASVVGLDLDERSLEVARRRCELYQVDVELIAANATEVDTLFAGRRFDMVIFYASLEHMLHQERIDSIRAAWRLLAVGDLCSVIETPNRLWYFDAHTSQLPFFHWLPDELAFAYSRFSDRPDFGDRYRELSAESLVHFQRRGRGVSYHEFELALGPVAELAIVGHLATFRRQRNLARRALWRLTPRGRYESLLRKLTPDVPREFLHSSLDLVLRK